MIYENAEKRVIFYMNLTIHAKLNHPLMLISMLLWGQDTFHTSSVISSNRYCSLNAASDQALHCLQTVQQYFSRNI